MKIYSKLLQKEIELNDENGVITHESLEDFILNQLSDRHIRYDTKPVDASTDHPVFQCVIQDSQDRRVVSHGEAHADSLISDIQRRYPALTAEKRAFDRAAVLYLGLPSKMITADGDITQITPAANENVPSVTPASPVAEPTPADNTDIEELKTRVYSAGKKYRDAGKTYWDIVCEDEGYAVWCAEKGRNAEDAKIFARLLEARKE